MQKKHFTIYFIVALIASGFIQISSYAGNLPKSCEFLYGILQDSSLHLHDHLDNATKTLAPGFTIHTKPADKSLFKPRTQHVTITAKGQKEPIVEFWVENKKGEINIFNIQTTNTKLASAVLEKVFESFASPNLIQSGSFRRMLDNVLQQAHATHSALSFVHSDSMGEPMLKILMDRAPLEGGDAAVIHSTVSPSHHATNAINVSRVEVSVTKGSNLVKVILAELSGTQVGNQIIAGFDKASHGLGIIIKPESPTVTVLNSSYGLAMYFFGPEKVAKVTSLLDTSASLAHAMWPDATKLRLNLLDKKFESTAGSPWIEIAP